MSAALTKEFIYNSSIDTVWKTLTDQEKMKKWYFPQLQEFQPKIGFRFEFNDPDAEYQKEWIVTELIDGKRLGHSWAYRGFSGISEVTFDLYAEDRQRTTLRITQTGLDSFPKHPHFKKERFEQGWDNLLGRNLRNLLANDV